jgi:large subunit ribosomal protein L18
MAIMRHDRLRKGIQGTSERPRLAIFRSSRHIYAQLIDDSKGATITAANTLQKDLAKVLEGKNRVEEAGLIGAAVARKALALGVRTVVFDRGGLKYHGRVKALADGAREAGLEF